LETPQKPQYMPSSFVSPTLIKLPLVPPLPVPSALLPIISVPSSFTINPIDYEMFDNIEEFLISENCCKVGTVIRWLLAISLRYN